jgi:hypothetical protein
MLDRMEVRNVQHRQAVARLSVVAGGGRAGVPSGLPRSESQRRLSKDAAARAATRAAAAAEAAVAQVRPGTI